MESKINFNYFHICSILFVTSLGILSVLFISLPRQVAISSYTLPIINDKPAFWNVVLWQILPFWLPATHITLLNTLKEKIDAIKLSSGVYKTLYKILSLKVKNASKMSSDLLLPYISPLVQSSPERQKIY